MTIKYESLQLAAAVTAMMILVAVLLLLPPTRLYERGFHRPDASHPVNIAHAADKADYPQIASQLNGYLQARHIEHSLYFEDLANHKTVRLDTDRDEIAASLLKLPVVMALYHLSEKHEIDLDAPVTIQAQWIDPTYGELWKQGAGSQISLREAARLALEQSDNTAIAVIRPKVKDLNVEASPMEASGSFPDVINGMGYVSAHAYSGYLRCLYMACYLNRENSDTIIQELEHTPFHGLPDGVPPAVKVAHKIGEANSVHSDCGIVFYPDHPYVLCVMLNMPGSGYQRVLTDISKITYDGVDALYKSSSPSKVP